ncbi:MAG: hypothetical protein HONBIEJF_02843 [Fimbriimonadaceae bacterium]|nr:hypothetical protein [Fimbriimonadaceae bacterium]
MRLIKRIVALLVLTSLALAASAGTLTITSPTKQGNEDIFFGKSNTIRFSITGARVEVTVKATITDPNGGTITIEKTVNPNIDGEAQDSIAVNFNDTAVEGLYQIKVTATEQNNTYNEVTLEVRVDVKSPTFISFNPPNNSFVNGAKKVPIRAQLKETAVKEWRVQINSQDIPNNTGSTNDVLVDWDASAIQKDGVQTITIKATDKSGNESTKTISVTLDRVAPAATIDTPRSTDVIPPNSRVTVNIIVEDQFPNAVTSSGISVQLRRMDNRYIGRVARIQVKNEGNNTRWTGRVRKFRKTPSQYKIVVTATDRAGNKAIKQEVIVSIGRGR